MIFRRLAEVVRQRRHVGVEAAEQEAAVVLEPRDLRQVMRAVAVEGLRVAGGLGVLHLQQLAGVVEGPAVERTGVGRLVAALEAAEHRAAVRTGVDEGVEFALAIPGDDDRLAADVRREEVVVVRHLALVGEIDPVALEDRLHLQLEQLGVGEDVAGHAEDAALGVVLQRRLDPGLYAVEHQVVSSVMAAMRAGSVARYRQGGQGLELVSLMLGYLWNEANPNTEWVATIPWRYDGAEAASLLRRRCARAELHPRRRAPQHRAAAAQSANPAARARGRRAARSSAARARCA